MTMNKEQAIILARSYLSGKKDYIKFNELDSDDYQLFNEVYDYIFGSCIFDLNKFVDDDLVEFKIATDIGVEVIKLNLEEYLNSDLFYKNN